MVDKFEPGETYVYVDDYGRQFEPVLVIDVVGFTYLASQIEESDSRRANMIQVIGIMEKRGLNVYNISLLRRQKL